MFENWGTIGDDAADFRLSAFVHFENVFEGFNACNLFLNLINIPKNVDELINCCIS